jgi:hypothetical protein
VAWQAHGDAIVALRRAAGAPITRDDDDVHGTHFVATDGTGPLAAVRITFASRSALDFEPLLAAPIPMPARGEFVAASRFAVARHAGRAVVGLLRALIRASWLHAWPLGARVALLAAPDRLVPVYRRVIGAVPLGPACTHPRTGRHVRLMVALPAPQRGGVIDDIVDRLPGPRVSTLALAYLDALDGQHAAATP